MTLADSAVSVRASLKLKASDPLGWFRFAVPRIADAFRMFVGPDPIDELALIGPNKAGKTLTKAFYSMACCQKRRTLDGVELPQWRGPVHWIQYVRDYPQQLLSVRPAYERALGKWPGHISYDGEYIKAINVMPVGGNPHNDSDWSVIHFLSQKNVDAGLGARADGVDFDEPAVLAYLHEMRKAGHYGRRSIILHGFTPLKRREWRPIRDDYGECPRQSIRRIDESRAIVRWSFSEMPDWAIPAKEKQRQLAKWRNTPLGEAREHGDYENTEGACPFNVETIDRMRETWCREPEIWKVKAQVETPEGVPRQLGERLPIQVWNLPKPGRTYYIVIDPASGAEGGTRNPLCLHVYDDETGELCARWNGYVAPYTLGSAAAVIHRHYNQAWCDIEMNDHWGANVLRGYEDGGGGALCYEQRELRPGIFAPEVGFGVTAKTRSVWVGNVQEWIDAFEAGVPYAPCPSKEVFEGIIATELDDMNRVISAQKGADHGEDFNLRAQSLRRIRRPEQSVREVYALPVSQDELRSKADAELVALVKGSEDEERAPEWLHTDERPRW